MGPQPFFINWPARAQILANETETSKIGSINRPTNQSTTNTVYVYVLMDPVYLFKVGIYVNGVNFNTYILHWT